MRILGPLLLVLGACAGRPAAPAPAPAAGTAAPPPAAAGRFPARPTLEDVLLRTADTPVMRAALASVREAEGRRTQDAFAPNPVLGYRAERIDVDDPGAGPRKHVVSLSERIETAGKRAARSEAASRRVGEAAAAADAERLRVARAAALAHQETIAAGRLVALIEEQRGAAARLADLQERLVATGRAVEATLPPLRVQAARFAVARVEEHARGRAALRSLEGMLALPPGTIEGVDGALLLDRELTALTGEELSAHPEVVAHRYAGDAALEEIEQARARAWPDVTVGMQYEDNDIEGFMREQSLGLFVEVPLPLVDRNQGGRRGAQAAWERSRSLEEDAAVRIAAGHAERCEIAHSLRASRHHYTGAILPARERELALAESAHAAGRADALAVEEARLALLEDRVALARLEERIAALTVEALALSGRAPEEW